VIDPRISRSDAHGTFTACVRRTIT
jgi:hypothetical protein